MEIKLKGREMPRGPKGDVEFKYLLSHSGQEVTVELRGPSMLAGSETVLDFFTPEEVVELVNRAIYQLEYQRESHRKRSAKQREVMRATEEALREAGKDAKVEQIKSELEGK